MARVVFFGTPELAVPSLEALCDAGMSPGLVVSRPDRPVGRGHRLASPPVVEAARARGLEVLQPESVRDPAFLDRVAAFAPDVAVVLAYGRIFPPALLALPRRGCVNIHASLLPRHRGASPIQAAILAGDEISGCCLMLMEAGLDTGPVIACRSLQIGPRETAGELGPRLARLGADLVAAELPRWIDGSLVAIPQPIEGVTVAPLVRKEDGRVDWNDTAVTLDRKLRAYTPWPGLVAELGAAPLRLLEAVAVDGSTEHPPGSIVEIGTAAMVVACGRGSLLAIGTVQRPGRRAVASRDLANGEHLEAGMRFDAVAP